MTLLANGQVLVAGGQDNSFNALTSAELYDPASETWAVTGMLTYARFEHAATLLPDGKVLVVGGLGNGTLFTATAEIYDPASGTWTETGSLATGRYIHTATLLANGKVLVAGGENFQTGLLASAELYDPATGIWTETGSLATGRENHTATLLPNGKVLVAGGYRGESLASAELYDPATGTWTETGSLATGRYLHTATLLPNGKVLAAGGFLYCCDVSASAELYDPATGTWTETGSLATGRDSHTATLLPNGEVLAAGGEDADFNQLASAELYKTDFSVASTDPACNSLISTQPKEFIVNVTEPVKPGTLQASDFTVNGIPANTVDYSPGDISMTFHFNSSPVVTQGVQTMHIPAGAILSASDRMPIFEFTCTFCYAVMPLQVTTTNPPVGGTFSPSAPGDYQYDVNFNQAIDPASVQTSDLTLTGNAGGRVTAVSVIDGNMTARFTVHFNFGGSATASIGAGAITAFGCDGNVDFSGDYTVEGGCLLGNYVITPGTDTIVPGTTDTGNHVDDGDTLISLPFPFTLYENTYTSVNVSSNGRLDFVCGVHETFGVLIACIPAPPNQCPYDFTIFGLWVDMRTDFGLSGCAGFPGGNCGIFTSVSGNAPDRIFNIEWRTVLFANNGKRQNFEVRLYENPAMNQRFDVIYGALDTIQHDNPYVGGVQGDGDAGFFTQDFCRETPPQQVSRTYAMQPCGGSDFQLVSAASRKTHGIKGAFDINLPLTGDLGIECRTGLTKTTIVYTFNNEVTGADSASSSCGTVSSITVDRANSHNLLVSLNAAACNAQTATVTLANVHDSVGNTLGSASASVGILVGDVDGDGKVRDDDIDSVRLARGQQTDSSNFRDDVTLNGTINNQDLQTVRSHKGESLP
jgi:hypothetical protein